MLLNVRQDGVSDRVHVAVELRDVLIVDEGLGEELSTFVSDHIVSQVKRSNLQVLLEEFYEGLDRL